MSMNCALIRPGSELWKPANRFLFDVVRVADQDQQRRGLAGDAGDAEHDAGDQSADIAVGMTTRMIVFHFGTPSA